MGSTTTENGFSPAAIAVPIGVSTPVVGFTANADTVPPFSLAEYRKLPFGVIASARGPTPEATGAPTEVSVPSVASILNAATLAEWKLATNRKCADGSATTENGVSPPDDTT